MMNEMKKEDDLETRKKILDNLEEMIANITKIVLETSRVCENVEIKDDKKIVYFTVNGKKYSYSSNMYRIRKFHRKLTYVGSTCGDSMSDSPYQEDVVYDEEE